MIRSPIPLRKGGGFPGPSPFPFCVVNLWPPEVSMAMQRAPHNRKAWAARLGTLRDARVRSLHVVDDESCGPAHGL